MSAGVILVDARGRVLMQLRDDDPKIMYPGHWGLTGGAAIAGETPEQAARREITEETGLVLDAIEPFRAYYFSEGAGSAGAKRTRAKASADYDLYVYHAPCETPAEELVCGEGQRLQYFAPDEFPALDVAYNHRDILSDFFASPTYAQYASGAAFRYDASERIEPLDRFMAELDAGAPWFDALMQAIALWERPEEQVLHRTYRYLVSGEAFDWLLLAERLIAAADGRIEPSAAELLLFEGRAPADGLRDAGRLSDDHLRELIGESKHRAHLNYVYGVTVEEALQYAVELEIGKERVNVNIKDRRSDEAQRDPIYERIYGEPCAALLRDFRDEMMRPHNPHIALSELREFMYWLFKYRVKNQEPARVASDTRKALAQLSAMELAVRRAARTRPEAPAEPATT